MTFSFIERVESALKAIQKGKIIILTDHPERENEGDFICAASMITPDIINFILRHSSGIICLPLLEEQLKKLGLPLMVSEEQNTNHWKTPFTLSIEAAVGVSTGVSALDRTTTILAAIKENATPDDVVVPGHVFPLRAQAEGVLMRKGHTEGAIDLVRLAGLTPTAAVLCEIMNPDGSMMRGKALNRFAKKHALEQLSVDDIVQYRLRYETLIQESISTTLPLKKYGQFTMTVIKEKISGDEQIVLRKMISSTENDPSHPYLVRIHSACVTGDLFHSERCDCHQQLHYALQKISVEGGMLIYLNQEGRGIGLLNKIKAYALQEKGLDTVEANEQLGLPIDARQYYIAAHILKHFKINKIQLLTNNPHKINSLKQYSLATITQEALPMFYNAHNKSYLQTKKNKLEHFIKDNENQ